MKSGQHQSLCKDGDRSRRWLAAFPCVTKIILGRSEACRHRFAPGTIRLSAQVDAGFKIKIYGGTGVTDGYLYVVSDKRAYIREQIEKRFGRDE